MNLYSRDFRTGAFSQRQNFASVQRWGLDKPMNASLSLAVDSKVCRKVD